MILLLFVDDDNLVIIGLELLFGGIVYELCWLVLEIRLWTADNWHDTDVDTGNSIRVFVVVVVDWW